MRIARPIPPAPKLTGTYSDLSTAMAELSREMTRASNAADVQAARNLRRSRALASR